MFDNVNKPVSLLAGIAFQFVFFIFPSTDHFLLLFIPNLDKISSLADTEDGFVLPRGGGGQPGGEGGQLGGGGGGGPLEIESECAVADSMSCVLTGFETKSVSGGIVHPAFVRASSSSFILI